MQDLLCTWLTGMKGGESVLFFGFLDLYFLIFYNILHKKERHGYKYERRQRFSGERANWQVIAASCDSNSRSADDQYAL